MTQDSLKPPTPRLAAFNRRWSARLELFRRYVAPPWWGPGLVLDAEIRARYERYLPVGEYLDALRALALDTLPDPSWVPRLLHAPRAGCCDGAGHGAFPSIADFWAALPVSLAGQVTLEVCRTLRCADSKTRAPTDSSGKTALTNAESDRLLAESALLPLFCALAAPPRFGTDFGRYPDQLRRLAEFAAGFSSGQSGPAPLHILDLGCGTGQGTLELAATLARTSGGPVQALGITAEPLEAWMATVRRLPHDPEREPALAAFRMPESALCHFLAADATAVPCRGAFDLIVANGLVGGRFLRSPQALNLFLSEVERLLASGGRASFANHFHQGELGFVAAAMRTAAAAGWQVTGTPRDWQMRRQ